MPNKEEVVQRLSEQKLLPLFYHESEETSLRILQALFAAGVRVVEYTNRGANAFANFQRLQNAARHHMPGMLLGIGTIKNAEDAKRYINAGAHFIVCPTTNPAVAKAVHAAGLLWVPGCMTPTEMAVAEEAGATLVKVFPGSLLGPSYITAVKELFPRLLFMPTGGVETELSNLKEWFAAGVVAVGMGSKLISKETLRQNDFDGLRKTTALTLQMIKEVSATDNKR